MSGGEERRGDGELPEGWRTEPSDNLFEFVTSGSRGWAQYYSEAGPIFVRIGNLDHGTIRLDLSDIQHVRPPVNAEGERTRLRADDILISITAELGMVGIVPPDLGEAYINQHVALARPNPKQNARYLAHFFSHEGKRQLLEMRRGATKAGLGLDDIRNVQVALPPLPEQRRIVAKLESLQARSRRAREALEAVPSLLEKLRQSILAAAFRGDLTADWRAQHPDVEPASELLKRIRIERRKKWEEAELAKLKAKGKTPTDDKWKQKYVEPEEPDFQNGHSKLPDGWTWASVAELTDCLDGKRVPITRADRKPGPYPYFGANGQVDSVASYLFDEALVLVTEDETFYGRTRPIAYRVDGKCWVNNHAHVLRASAPLSPDYVCYALMHYPVTRWLSGTTGRAKLTQGALNSLPIALAPIEEQTEILRRVSKALLAEPHLDTSMREAAKSIEELDALVLSKAFRGELVPQDPNDVTETLGDAQTTPDVPAPIQTKKTAKPGTRAHR